MVQYWNEENDSDNIHVVSFEDIATVKVIAPQQTNGFDCGIYVIWNIYRRAHGFEISPSSHPPPHFRSRVARWLMKGIAD